MKHSCQKSALSVPGSDKGKGTEVAVNVDCIMNSESLKRGLKDML